MLLASVVLLTVSVATEGGPDAYGPPAPPPVTSSAKQASDTCKSQDPRDIVVCAQRKQGLRLDPDVVNS